MWFALCFVLLTGNLKKIGEKDDGLCGFAPVWPEPKKRACEQPAQTEGGQTQTQEVRRGLQNLEIPPYCRQNDSWAREGWRRMSVEEKEGDEQLTGLVYPQENIFQLNQMPYPLGCVLTAKMPGRFCSNETIISCLQVFKAAIINLPYSMPLSINISPMERKVRFLFWWLFIVLSDLLPFIHRPLSAYVVQKCCSVA